MVLMALATLRRYGLRWNPRLEIVDAESNTPPALAARDGLEPNEDATLQQGLSAFISRCTVWNAVDGSPFGSRAKGVPPTHKSASASS